ncbi:MAG TPA: HPr-rel-A system PqqD family peptide chaperone [Pedomonas sp.]
MSIAFQSFLSRDCLVRPVDDLFLVFFRPSGQTHMLPVTSVALLDVLDGNALSIAEIPAVLAERYGTEAEEGVEASVERLLRELEAVGLVEAVTTAGPSMSMTALGGSGT